MKSLNIPRDVIRVRVSANTLDAIWNFSPMTNGSAFSVVAHTPNDVKRVDAPNEMCRRSRAALSIVIVASVKE